MEKREVYLDYAASTPLCKESVDAMHNAMTISTGNPSSSHFAGRKSNVVIEQSRRSIADLLHCLPQNIVFTSSGTESIYLGIYNICKTYRPRSIIAFFSEHEIVKKAITNAAKSFIIPVIYLECDVKDDSFLNQLNKQLEKYPSSLLCFAHANHFSGEMLPVKEVGKLCQKHRSLFFCNMIQTIGKYDINLSELPVDFAVASAHKFGGSKGIGLFYHKQEISPLLEGENHENNMRAGIENIYGICSMEAALRANMEHLESHQNYIASIKSYSIERLIEKFSSVNLVGNNEKKGLHNLFSFYFLDTDMENVYMQLDIAGIAVSLCTEKQDNHSLLRLSFDKQTTMEEVDYFIDTLSDIRLKNNPA
jgi:cysteine desulfurase